jgi:hypothetical protein
VKNNFCNQNYKSHIPANGYISEPSSFSIDPMYANEPQRTVGTTSTTTGNVPINIGSKSKPRIPVGREIKGLA